jgi:hypothetical protein
MDVTEITEILNRKRGESIVYHIGHIAIDSHVPSAIDAPGIEPRTRDERQAVADTKLLAARLCRDGKCALVQRRLGTNRYEYIAQRA